MARDALNAVELSGQDLAAAQACWLELAGHGGPLAAEGSDDAASPTRRGFQSSPVAWGGPQADNEVRGDGAPDVVLRSRADGSWWTDERSLI